ncbi:hypothetical protein niasHS_003277 [Heterodera schachtii]|uniref:Uncharacterized protein n=1 Tax=Heterodera schachtii TaxID=97005 RepID=A0ABD2KG15_HETSC
MLFVLSFSLFPPLLGFNHFLKCSSSFIHAGPWEIELYDLINEVSGTLRATEEKRNISCISYAGSMCLNATCRVDSRHAYLAYHHCVFNGEYDFCERFNAQCQALNGHGGCNLCDSHHCNTAPEEAEEGEGEEEKHNGAGGEEEKRGTAAHHSHDEMPTEKAQKMANESAPPPPPPVNPSDVRHILVGPSKSAGEKTDALSQQQQGNFGGGGSTFWDFVFFFGVFVACVMLAVFGYKELRKRGFFVADGERQNENLI